MDGIEENFLRSLETNLDANHNKEKKVSSLFPNAAF